MPKIQGMKKLQAAKRKYVPASIFDYFEVADIDFSPPKLTQDEYTVGERIKDYGHLFTCLGHSDHILIGILAAKIYYMTYEQRPCGSDATGQRGLRRYGKVDVEVIDDAIKAYVVTVIQGAKHRRESLGLTLREVRRGV